MFRDPQSSKAGICQGIGQAVAVEVVQALQREAGNSHYFEDEEGTKRRLRGAVGGAVNVAMSRSFSAYGIPQPSPNLVQHIQSIVLEVCGQEVGWHQDGFSAMFGERSIDVGRSPEIIVHRVKDALLALTN
jgi:hypothetical protein